MAIDKVDFQSRQFVPVYPCQTVSLFLTVAGSAKTTADNRFITATVENNGRYLGSGGMPFSPRFENSRGEEDYQYSLSYDDSLLVSTDAPLECGDIIEILPYAGIAQLIALAGA